MPLFVCVIPVCEDTNGGDNGHDNGGEYQMEQVAETVNQQTKH